MKKLLFISCVFISLSQIINAGHIDNACGAFIDAARINNLVLLKKLLKTVNLDCQNEFGYTALHYAVMNNSDELLKLLIERNASALLVDIFGYTPARRAHQLNQMQHARALDRLANKQYRELSKNGYLSI